MIQVIYRWHVPEQHRMEFLTTWARTTRSIRDSTVGARGSVCLVSTERPTEVLTIAKWDNVGQWRDFVAEAKSTSMKRMHELATLTSHEVYEQRGDFTV